MTSIHNHDSIPEELQSLSEKRQRWVDANEENAFGKGIRNLLTELYPENAHFIYELLQNAEDAGADTVTFRLFEDQLHFEHDGKSQFSKSDIESITSIGSSTKRDDPTAIGKFGVGFKAVFAYTESPEVHSGRYHFRIRDLVVPDAEGVKRRSVGEKTLFIFPFNHTRKTKAQAVSEIQRGLLALADNTLLFLRNIRSLFFTLPDKTEGYIKRIYHKSGRIEIQCSQPSNDELVDAKSNPRLDLQVSAKKRSDWLRFEKNVEVLDSENTVATSSQSITGVRKTLRCSLPAM